MKEIIEKLLDVLEHSADTCDAWADESEAGGWSTHQTQANRTLANEMRRFASQARRELRKVEADKPDNDRRGG